MGRGPLFPVKFDSCAQMNVFCCNKFVSAWTWGWHKCIQVILLSHRFWVTYTFTACSTCYIWIKMSHLLHINAHKGIVHWIRDEPPSILCRPAPWQICPCPPCKPGFINFPSIKSFLGQHTGCQPSKSWPAKNLYASPFLETLSLLPWINWVLMYMCSCSTTYN